MAGPTSSHPNHPMETTMSDTSIRPGQIYRSCDPRESIRIRITSYRPGDARAHVVDAVTGKRPRQLLVRQLHDSPTTAVGQPRRGGYVLERES